MYANYDEMAYYRDYNVHKLRKIEIIGINQIIIVWLIDCPNAMLMVDIDDFLLQELSVINASKLLSNAINTQFHKLKLLRTGICELLWIMYRFYR